MSLRNFDALSKSPVGDCQARCPDQTSECMDVKLMQGKLLDVQVLESYNMEVSCGQGIKVLSFQGVVEYIFQEEIWRPVSMTKLFINTGK
jgi:hypothetical protein